MEKIIDLLQQSKSLLSGEPSEENATEAYQLIAMALKEAQALRQPAVSGRSEQLFCPYCSDGELYDSILYDMPVCKNCGATAK
jgi:hypothetical protein